jgi:dienelactone hydrolase
MRRILATATLLLVPTALAEAQGMRFHYPAPPASAYTVVRDEAYGELKMDVYRPPSPTPAPALIFVNMAAGAERRNDFYAAWAAIAASKGLVAILPDLREPSFAADLDAALAHLTARGAALGVDRDRIAVYAGSGNVWRSLSLFLDPKRTAIRAAVIYYGAPQVTAFRPDLPLLLVRPGLDRPGVTGGMADLARQALTQNVPVTIVNYAGGHHAFEIVDDEEVTRAVVDDTVAFVVRATAPAYQASLRRGMPDAIAAGYVAAGNMAAAVTAFAELVKARPDDARLKLSYGEALLGAGRFPDACATFATLKGKGLGARDLGLPAARACVQAGDADAAVAWIAGIPAQYRPAAIATEPVFAPLTSRADFQALFPAAR